MHRTNRHGNSTFTVLWGNKGNRSYPRLGLPHGQFDITTVLQPALPPSTTRHQLVLVVRRKVHPYHGDRVSSSLHAIKLQHNNWDDVISFISYQVSSATTRTTAVLATANSNAIDNRRYTPLTTIATSPMQKTRGSPLGKTLSVELKNIAPRF